LLAIANDLASQSEEHARLVRKGMETALDLRAEFWSNLENETTHILQ
jgi:predicted DNA-binding ribbon-helix-helix protein